MKLKRFFCIVALLNFCAVFGQKTIKGQILNEKNNPIEYASVGIVGKKLGVISDNKGFFEIKITSPDDKIFFSHLSFVRKELKINDFPENGKIILQEKEIELSPVVISTKMRKLKTIRPFGMRVPGGNAQLMGEMPEKKAYIEGVGDFITLKKDHLATEFRMDCLENKSESALLRLEFYKVEEGNSLTPLIASPIYINIPKTDKKIEIVEEISVHLPKGKIWIELQVINTNSLDWTNLTFPVSFSGSWVREDTEFRKVPLGIGFSFAVKGYVMD